MHFITTTMKRRRSRCGRQQKVNRNRAISNKDVFICCKCNKEFDISVATLEHTVPDIIIRASAGKLTAKDGNYKLSCRSCNNHDPIPNWLGILFKSSNIKEIEFAARHLCNLVRNPK